MSNDQILALAAVGAIGFLAWSKAKSMPGQDGPNKVESPVGAKIVPDAVITSRSPQGPISTVLDGAPTSGDVGVWNTPYETFPVGPEDYGQATTPTVAESSTVGKAAGAAQSLPARTLPESGTFLMGWENPYP